MSGEQDPVSWTLVRFIVACSNFLAAVWCLFAFQALIRKPSIRRSPYNIYVIGLVFPDSIQNLMTVLWNVFYQPFPQGYYEVSMFVWFFYFFSNFYLNAVVAYEIYTLADASSRRQKISRPKTKRAWKQVAAVYLFACAISAWFVLPCKWSPMDINNGPEGILRYGSPNGGVFGPLVVPLVGFCLISIPITYVVYIRIRIAYYKLLPKRGRTRILSLFFLRIIIVFLIFYLPNAVLNAVFDSFEEDSSPYFWSFQVITPLLTASQAFVTLFMLMWKHDIHKALVDDWNDSLGRCCCRLAAPLPRRPSAEISKSMKLVILAASGDASGDGSGDASGDGSVDASKFMASAFNSTSSSSRPLQAQSRTKWAIPITMSSEWEEEDSYSDGHPDADPTIVIPEQDTSEKRDEMSEQCEVEEKATNWI